MERSSDYIYFGDNSIKVKHKIYLSTTNKVINQIRDAGFDPKETIRRISHLERILITSTLDNNNSRVYKMYTSFGVLSCKGTTDIHNNTTLLILGYKKPNLRDSNVALVYGEKINANRGIAVKVTSKEMDCFSVFERGMEYDLNSYSSIDGSRAIREIDAIFNEKENGLDAIDNQDEISEELIKLLELAENYSCLTNELERKKADEIGKVSYRSYKSIEYNRQDRVAYEFCIDKQKEQIFNIGMNVDIVDSNDECLATAEIIDYKTNDINDFITMLFVHEVDLSDVPKQGYLRISVSTVNMDVQTKAIYRLRNKKAKAKYFDDVLGKKKTNGFEKNDLKDIKQDFKNRKYPPNKSQVQAIEKGINTKDVYLVMGPPGTGKTTVILEWVKYFVQKKRMRVLVSSQNNKAVDNVLERLSEEKDIDTIRIGSEAKVQDEITPYLFENKINDLRRKIVDSTSKAIDSISKSIKAWTEYLKRVNEHVNVVNVSNSLYEKAKTFAKTRIQPSKNELIKLKNNNEKLLRKIKHTRDIYINKKAFVDSYGQKGALLKIILFVLWILAKKNVKFRFKSLQQLVENQNNVAESYNAKYKELKNLYNQFDQDYLEPFYESYIGMMDSAIRIKENIPNGNKEYGVFNDKRLNVEQYDIRKNAKEFQKTIVNAKERASNICETIQEWKKEVAEKQNYALEQIILDSVDLVGATCIGVNSQRRFQDLDFDITIIDEAGQIQLHNAFVPMSVSNKLIMLGDHMQIPPNVDQDMVSLCEDNNVQTDYLGKSLFEKMYNELSNDNETLLDTQYRMPAEIADIISEWFYGGEYKSPDMLRNMESKIPSISSKNLILIDTSKNRNRLERKDPEGGYNNPFEANIIGKVVNHIIGNTDFSEKQLGIISAYKSQVKLIQKELRKTVPPQLVGGMAASLDSFQGQERDVIIYSFTRSSKRNENQSRIGFLNELRRLNVAMSRCKKTLIMIGDFDYLSNCKKQDADVEVRSTDGKRIVNGSEETFSKFINFMCNKVREGKGEMIDSSILLERIED